MRALLLLTLGLAAADYFRGDLYSSPGCNGQTLLTAALGVGCTPAGTGSVALQCNGDSSAVQLIYASNNCTGESTLQPYPVNPACIAVPGMGFAMEKCMAGPYNSA